MRQTQDEMQILTALAATGFGVPMKVTDFRHILFAIHTTASFNGTIKCKGSLQEGKPDFSAASSKSNQWDFIQLKKYTDNTTVDGATGVTSAGTDINAIYEANTNGLTWITLDITAYTAGTVDAYGKPFNDCG